eukprot:14319936-Heterocapsa_arctica.AAC.1
MAGKRKSAATQASRASVQVDKISSSAFRKESRQKSRAGKAEGRTSRQFGRDAVPPDQLSTASDNNVQTNTLLAMTKFAKPNSNEATRETIPSRLWLPSKMI